MDNLKHKTIKDIAKDATYEAFDELFQTDPTPQVQKYRTCVDVHMAIYQYCLEDTTTSSKEGNQRCLDRLCANLNWCRRRFDQA